MRLDCTHSDQVVDSLRQLRATGDRERAELYWNVQRLRKARCHAAAVRDHLTRRRGLQIFRQPPPELPIPSALPPHAA